MVPHSILANDGVGLISERSGDAADLEAVQAANQAFYDAFEAADIDAMSAVWEHSDRTICTHPGWRALHGWGQISGSWFAIFGNPARLQFILTEPRVNVVGDVAWVTLDENLLDAQRPSTVSACNLFVRTAEGWRMVMHQGSPVLGQ